jgi:hypothetical protein
MASPVASSGRLIAIRSTTEGARVAMLVWGASRCSICREVLVQGQTIVATTHFIGDPTDPLWRFSDSGMHATCFDRWEHRDEFGARYYAALGETLTGWVPAVPANPGGPPLPRLWLGVLGTPENRAVYFETLRAHIDHDAERGAAPDTGGE